MVAVNVCLSSKSRNGFGWHDCYLTFVHDEAIHQSKLPCNMYLPMYMYIQPYFIYFYSRNIIEYCDGILLPLLFVSTNRRGTRPF